MPLNNTQSEFVERVRQGKVDSDSVIAEIEGAPTEAYRTDAFLEMLVALDSTHRLRGDRWYRVIVERTKNESYIFDRGRIDKEGLTRIRAWVDRHGAGEWVIELLVEMMFEDGRHPPRTPIIIRWAIRRLYSGIHPITEHGLFVLRKWFGLSTDNGAEVLKSDDAKLIGYINRHTKGLNCVNGFERLFSDLLIRYATVEENGAWKLQRAAKCWLSDTIESEKEICANEQLLLTGLKRKVGELPQEWQDHLDRATPALFSGS